MSEPTTVSLRTGDGVRLVADHWAEHGSITGTGTGTGSGSGDIGSGGSGSGDIGSGTVGRGATVAVVVAHGFTMSARNPHLRRLCAGLAARGFDVLAADFRGHGRSGGLGTAGADEIYDIAAAVAWLRARGHEFVAVIGWSMGGTAVLRHAGLGGDADAVVSVSAPGVWFERGTRPMRVVHWMFEHRLGRAAARYLRRTRVSPDGWQTLPEAPAEVAGAIAPRPLLIVHGDADPYFPMHHPQAISAGAPHAQVWIESGMGHAEIATSDDLLGRIADWIAHAARTARAAQAP